MVAEGVVLVVVVVAVGVVVVVFLVVVVVIVVATEHTEAFEIITLAVIVVALSRLVDKGGISRLRGLSSLYL